MINLYCLEDFYNRLKNDLEYRSHVIKNPKQAMCELHGVDASSIPDVKFEIIEQAEDTITIVLPVKPENYTPDQKAVAKKAADQTVDLIYKKGIPGFFIPNEKLRWVLLTMRRSWFHKEGIV